jgi:hypothetical protein
MRIATTSATSSAASFTNEPSQSAWAIAAVRKEVAFGKVRWVVESTHAWLHHFRPLCTRFERRACTHETFLKLGCCSSFRSSLLRLCSLYETVSKCINPPNRRSRFAAEHSLLICTRPRRVTFICWSLIFSKLVTPALGLTRTGLRVMTSVWCSFQAVFPSVMLVFVY